MFFDVCSLHVEFHLYLQAHVASERDFLRSSRTKKKSPARRPVFHDRNHFEWQANARLSRGVGAGGGGGQEELSFSFPHLALACHLMIDD